MYVCVRVQWWLSSKESLDAGVRVQRSFVQVNLWIQPLLARFWLIQIFILKNSKTFLNSHLKKHDKWSNSVTFINVNHAQWKDNCRGSCKSSLRFHSYLIVSRSESKRSASTLFRGVGCDRARNYSIMVIFLQSPIKYISHLTPWNM